MRSQWQTASPSVGASSEAWKPFDSYDDFLYTARRTLSPLSGSTGSGKALVCDLEADFQAVKSLFAEAAFKM